MALHTSVYKIPLVQSAVLWSISCNSNSPVRYRVSVFVIGPIAESCPTVAKKPAREKIIEHAHT